MVPRTALTLFALALPPAKLTPVARTRASTADTNVRSMGILLRFPPIWLCLLGNEPGRCFRMSEAPAAVFQRSRRMVGRKSLCHSDWRVIRTYQVASQSLAL